MAAPRHQQLDGRAAHAARRSGDHHSFTGGARSTVATFADRPPPKASCEAWSDEAGLGDRIEVDSAGTGGYHNGSGTDPRSTEEAARRGIDISGQKSRQTHVGDFAFFDLLIAMDESNLTNLVDLAPDLTGAAKVRRLREFDPTEPADLDVPTRTAKTDSMGCST